jgi:alpha-galactosidase
MDDCWAHARTTSGQIVADPTSFPKGVKDVADYVHSKGLKFGIYTDRGTQTCATRPGSVRDMTATAATAAVTKVIIHNCLSTFAVEL